MTIAHQLRAALATKGWTIHKAAKVAESRGLAISRAYLYNIAGDQQQPTWPMILVICDLLEVEPSEFLSC